MAKFASEFQALDSIRTAAILDRHLGAEGRSLEVFVQVNTSNEPSKYGLPSDEVAAFMQQFRTFDHLHVKGLMTLAEFSASADRVRACFVRLRQLRDRLSDDRGVLQAGEWVRGTRPQSIRVVRHRRRQTVRYR